MVVFSQQARAGLAVIFVYILLALIAVIAAMMIVDRVRLSKHRGRTREQFVEALSKDGVPLEISGAVYDLYRTMSRSKSFGLNPEDSFEGFSIIHEDIDYDLEELVQKLGMEMPIEPILRDWPTEVKTLRDMALWLTWIRGHQSANPAC